jgi:hypothetical protein
MTQIANALIEHGKQTTWPNSRLRVHMDSNPRSASEVTSLGRRFYGNLTDHISKQKSTFEDVSMLNGSQLEPSDAELP